MIFPLIDYVRSWKQALTASRPIAIGLSAPANARLLIVLAHIREQFALSLGSYGRPGMTEELKEVGVDVGRRPVGRLVRESDIRVEKSKKYKATTQQPQLQHRVEPDGW